MFTQLVKGKEEEPANKAVSYYKDIRPIFQANCQGCHQPSKAKGKYIMTDFDKLISGGDSGDPAIVPSNLEKSYIVDLITPEDGEAEMPQKADPLHETEIDLIKKTYLARVHGDFKYEEYELNIPIFVENAKDGVMKCCEGDEEEVEEKRAK